jgi:hypothetical protein
MQGFRKFYESKTDDEAEESLKKLPKGHRALLKGYKFKFENGVNLKGYPDSIGLIHLGNPERKLIQVAAPWNYGREFAMLHEVGHRVYEQIMTKELKGKWAEIAKKKQEACQTGRRRIILSCLRQHLLQQQSDQTRLSRMDCVH